MLLSPSILVTVIETTNAVFSPLQLPELHQLLFEAAKLLNTEAPDLCIRQNPVPNAYALAINGKKPFIVVIQASWNYLLERNCKYYCVFTPIKSYRDVVFSISTIFPLHTDEPFR
jgi:Zn-dependent protease with chaperone function